MKTHKLIIIGLVYLAPLILLFSRPAQVYPARSGESLETRRVKEVSSRKLSIEESISRIVDAIEREDRDEIYRIAEENEDLFSRDREYWDDALNFLHTESWKGYAYAAIAATLYRLHKYKESIDYNIKSGDEFVCLKMFKEAADSYVYAGINYAIKLQQNVDAYNYKIKAAEYYYLAYRHKEAAEQYIVASDTALNYLNDPTAAIKCLEQAAENYLLARMPYRAINALTQAASMTRVKGVLMNYAVKVAEIYKNVRDYNNAGELYRLIAEKFKTGGKLDEASRYYTLAIEMFNLEGLFEKANECHERISGL